MMTKRERIMEWFLYKDRHRSHNLITLITKHGSLKLSNGYELKVNKKNYSDIIKLYYFTMRYGVELREESGYWKYRDGIIVTPDGIKFTLRGFNPTIFFETFVNDYHFVSFDLEQKYVINAGGFVGDTALYFAYKGAFVYSFEPDPNSYGIAVKNVELNPDLKGKITMRNWAVGRGDGSINFPVNENDSGSSSVFSPIGYKKVEVRSVSISTILKVFDIKEPFLLDLDVKGMEYEVINDFSISKFNIVRIEFSTQIKGKTIGTRKIIEEKLKKYGFTYFRIYSLGGMDLNLGGVIEARK